MNEICVFAICVCTANGMYRFIGATDGPINNELISNVIRDGFAEIGHECIPIDSVEDIVVPFSADTFDGVISPKIEDVWPIDFARETTDCYKCKKGGENYKHGKDDFFKNSR